MKTFETEKCNIPEGATHYRDECEEYQFSWVKFASDSMYFWCETYWDETEDYLFKLSVKPIPQTKEVEWVNGDKCRYSHDVEHEYVYVGEHPHGDGHYVFSEEKGITYIANGYLLEPETEAERVERERANAIYDMCASADNFTEESNFWAGKFYDLGYRKESE